MAVTIMTGDSREVVHQLEHGRHRACVTSPPYWRQRRYGDSPLELGQEPTPEAWVQALVGIFRGVRRSLTSDGSLWLNVGDKYAAGGMGGGGIADARKNWRGTAGQVGWRKPPPGFKPKDLTLSPFMLADALRQDGWYLRQVIVWEKAVAPEPPRLDRPSSSHEYVFLFSVGESSAVRDPGESWFHSSVWRIASDFDPSHVAKMPAELARRCIVAGTRPGDSVVDPFGGSGTTAIAADRLDRDATIIELYPDCADMADEKLRADMGPMLVTLASQASLFDEVAS